MKLVPLIRQTYDIGVMGKKGVGKSFILSVLGYIFYRFGNCVIFSNFPLNYPYVHISSINDFDKIYNMSRSINKKFLGDDFERWFHSHSSKSKVNKELNQIMLDFGKVNCSLLYSSKRSMAISIDLRESTSEFWFPELKLKYVSDDKRVNDVLKNYLNFLYIDVVRFDENLEQISNIRIDCLDKLCGLYDTSSIVKEIITES